MYRLGINTGFAVNRYAEPEDWIRLIGVDLGLAYVQLTADILNPSLPGPVLSRYVRRINKYCAMHKIAVTSTFTGGFTRVNHFAHPDKAVRAFWVDWFKRFVDLSVDLGAISLGSHFGIQTLRDDGSPKSRLERRRENIRCWHRVGAYARKKGLRFLSWEPMSIRREQGETINAARRLQRDVNFKAPLPFKMCLDLDHGDWSSKNPKDTDPYAWLSTFAKDSAQIHLKQTKNDSSGHKPFTAKNNERGKIRPKKVLDVLRGKGVADIDLIFEPSFKEREPYDRSVVPVMQESVEYWRRALPPAR